MLLAGERLNLPQIGVITDAWLRLVFAAGLPEISADGLEIEVVMSSGGETESVYRAGLRTADLGSGPRTVMLSLPARLAPYSLQIHCLPGPKGDPCGDWLALLEVTVGREADLDLLAARTFRQLRADYERSHFAHAYNHPMYVSRRTRVELGIDALIPSERSFSVPGAVQNAFDYALSRLSMRLEHKAPDFEKRLREKAVTMRTRPLRILSLCTGLGLTEGALLRRVNVPVDLTVVDINEHLLHTAESLMPPHVRVKRLVADANELEVLDGEFDVALCVSGFHHLVEFRKLLGQVRSALAESGELWLIGEQIGVSGNRLDEDALVRANDLFGSLDARFRRNMGTDRVDAVLDNRDCSEATFEGILSHQIEHELARQFRGVHVSRRNCFLWRIVGPEYVADYRIEDPGHREILDALVEGEVAYYLEGGRPTELHGVYAPLR